MPASLSRAITALALLLGIFAPSRVRAQESGRADGVAYDSLRKQPLAGAIVQLIEQPPGHAAYSSTTDSLGHFRLTGLHAGQYIAGILHPLLDTLGVLAPYSSVTIADNTDTHVALAIPSAARITGAICGAPKGRAGGAGAADSTGTLVGHVYDALTGAPVASGLIAIVWPVLAVHARGVHREMQQLHVKSNGDGWFAFCALDAGDYQLRAESGTRNTGYIDLSVEARGITWITLALAGDSSAGGSVAGRITTKDGRALEGAQVAVDGSAATAASDSRGVFSLSGLPLGTRMLEARALGFAPTRVSVTPSGDEQPPMTIVMEKRVETLQTVTVFGKETGRMRDLTGFVERSKRGFGHFITRDKIDRTTSASVCDLLREVPGVSVSSDSGIGCDASIRGMGSLSRCGFTVYLDNMKYGDSVRDFTRTVSPREIAGIEVYSSATEPAQFPGGCGSLVVWTR